MLFSKVFFLHKTLKNDYVNKLSYKSVKTREIYYVLDRGYC